MDQKCFLKYYLSCFLSLKQNCLLIIKLWCKNMRWVDKIVYYYFMNLVYIWNRKSQNKKIIIFLCILIIIKKKTNWKHKNVKLLCFLLSKRFTDNKLTLWPWIYSLGCNTWSSYVFKLLTKLPSCYPRR